MSTDLVILLIFAALLIYLDIIIIFRLLIRKLKYEGSKEASRGYKNIILSAATRKDIKIKDKIPVSDYLEMKQAIQLDKFKVDNIEKHTDISKVEKRYLKQMKSVFKTKRLEAIVYLGLIGTDKARSSLEKSISKEKNFTAKLYIANALSDIKNKESIPILISTLINSHRFYRERVNMLIADFGEDFNSYLPEIIKSNKIEIRELIVDFSSVYFSELTKSYLVELIDNMHEDLRKLQDLYGIGCNSHKMPPVSINFEINHRKLVYKACDILAQYYPSVLDNEKYLNSEDLEIKNIAIKALSNFNTGDRIEKLISFLRYEDTARSAVNAISIIIERNPGYINAVVSVFSEEKDIRVKCELAKVLSNRIEYFYMKLSKKSKAVASEIIRQMLYLGRTSEVIDFLNKNKDIDIENELIAIVIEVISQSENLQKEFSRYLKERLVKKCGLLPYKEAPLKKEEQKDKRVIVTLYILLAMNLLIAPVIYCVRHRHILLVLPFIEQVKIFIIDFNYYLAFYSIAVSLIYLGLLIFSYFSANKQVKLWKIKNTSMLFKKKILPSVSIIAPAYNEEKTILESTNSLLNLKYPNYELVLVNDGSKDNTLDVLIKYFNLIRVDHIMDYRLNTKPVRGIYKNRSLPKLTVVDKENGGKADSLNAGINISSREYFCGIDADSLLEDDALLKLASLTLDEGMETPALGGNIFPINGCEVEQGHIKNISIPKNKLARFQTIEYIRAFMAGRLGWAYINSLLIISGAFGLFRKERVISVGGYLTSSGKYDKDTVGEDMELVVRISRLMRELGHRYRICYAFNANCWTEVPENTKTLRKQRYRWQRGLIDILLFHKRMIFNPRYGRTGVVALPYFFIFEMMGPIFEIQGYLMVFLAFIFGLLNIKIALILFISCILMGVLISVSSLLIAEIHTKYFTYKDMLILIVYSIIENFGPRQILSFWRVGGYFSILKKRSGWDKAERKGFSMPNTTAKV